ncbi:MAG: twin-arginine translocation signal domain-containing protein [Chloroflexi bacterium]|nr:twin-arginine translocation signal domain-containing protein [Chloroflexota bacterium]
MSQAEHQITDNAETPEECQEQTISRRKLLKVLAATGGTVAATMLLPSKWAKPIVEVGVLPVHAQGTDPAPTEEPPEYSAICDSTPGGGDITSAHGLPSGTGRIDDIEARLILISGTGSVEGIEVTMTAEALAPSTSLPTFDPVLPITALTDADGIAYFGSLNVTGTPIEYFGLVFSYAVTIGDPIETTCTTYELH